ncbi:hypothetical protein [Methylomonas sp. LWB]|uniref:hypothetical protein n=1 Tax=Methylomonas sp. LWB TaxID=1905845 RepID=UPI0011152DB2|nr:hypothetical protein [Methylomonas sp. LWB]
MSMITMQGKLINTYQANSRVDQATGLVTQGKHKIQIMGHMPMESGESRLEMHDLTCNDLETFKPLQGKTIRFALGIMSSGDNTILFIPRGTKPEVIPVAAGGDKNAA